MLTQVGVSLLGRNKIRYQFLILIIRSRTFMQLKTAVLRCFDSSF